MTKSTNKEILFHYTSGQGLYGIINSEKLHCSNIQFLNDPTENIHFDKILEIVMSDNKECHDIYSTLFWEDYHEIILNQEEKYLISFSKNNDSLSMWNYYSQGNGYNIGVDIDSIIERSSYLLNIKKKEIIYEETEQVEILKNFIINSKEDYFLYKEKKKQYYKSSNDDENEYLKLNDEIQAISGAFTIGINDMRLSFKHPAYSSEKETRLIVSLDNYLNYEKDFKVSQNGVFIEFISLGLDLEKEIKSITTHPLHNELHHEGIKKFISRKVNNEIEIFESKIPFRYV